MNRLSLHYLPHNKASAEKLASRLNITSYPIEIHTFPDGESKLRVEPVSGTVALFGTLDHPNEKLVNLILAAATLRDLGATRLVLVAPYLCYMRQDMAFATGEAISQRVIGDLLSAYFDRVITVDPHLHRINHLQEVFHENCRADALSATGIITKALAGEGKTPVVLAGPDSESEQWVRAIAEPLSIPYVIGRKTRNGDRNVEISYETQATVEEAHVVLLDDVISSGMTILKAVEALKNMGAREIEVITVHMLAREEDLMAIRAAGVSRIRSTDSIVHDTNSLFLAPLLCEALEEEKEK